MPIGSKVVQAHATDPTGHVNYSMQAWRVTLEEAENPIFWMDSNGWVKTKALIDLENSVIKEQYKFKVEAGNNQGETASCWLIVTINDINDNPPIFSRPSYNFAVYENAPRKKIIGKVEISDADKIDRGKVKLQLKNRDSAEKDLKFNIDRSGRIFTIGEIDREIKSKYILDIIATDSIKPTHTAKVSH